MFAEPVIRGKTAGRRYEMGTLPSGLWELSVLPPYWTASLAIAEQLQCVTVCFRPRRWGYWLRARPPPMKKGSNSPAFDDDSTPTVSPYDNNIHPPSTSLLPCFLLVSEGPDPGPMRDDKINTHRSDAALGRSAVRAV